MENFTLRWSADRSLYFVEPSRGRNARGFWLGAEKKDFPVPPDAIKNPYSGAFAFDGYWRQWFSMRGFIVQQGNPRTKVPASAELVRDYLTPAHLVTLEEAIQVEETNRIEAAAAVKEAEAVIEAVEKEAQEKAARDAVIAASGGVDAEPNPRPLPEREGEQEPVATGGAVSGAGSEVVADSPSARPNKRARRRGN